MNLENKLFNKNKNILNLEQKLNNLPNCFNNFVILNHFKLFKLQINNNKI